MPNRHSILKAIKDNGVLISAIVIVAGIIYGYGALNNKVEVLGNDMLANGVQHQVIATKIDTINKSLSRIEWKLGIVDSDTAFCSECQKLAMSCTNCK